MSRQITLPGRDLDTNAQIKETSISINLDDQTGKNGLPISDNVYKDIVGRFNTDYNGKLRPKELPFYFIDKQLLLILISSEKCKTLLLSKCLRRDGVESIALAAADEKGKPIAIDVEGTAQILSTVKMSAGEWIQGITSAQVSPFIEINAFGEPLFNFEKFFTALENQTI